MNVLIFSQHFWPESFRINDIALSLVKSGINVTVLTAKPNYPDGIIYKGYKPTGCVKEDWNGIDILRIPIFPRGQKSSLRLFLNYISFILFGSIFGPWLISRRSVDVIFVYATSPLLQAIPALVVAKIKRIPVVLNVQDLWPESLAATGYIRSKWLIKIVDVVVGYIYKRVDLILISSRPFALSIKKYSPKANIVYYPNSVESSFCDPNSGIKLDVPELNNGFCVVFAGNVGAAQAVNVILEAAALLVNDKEIRFVILGSGSELERMRAQIEAQSLSNVYLAGRFPVEAMPNLLSRASALLVTLADREIFASTVPNKIQAYMAVGRPIIASLNGEGARIVCDAKAGLAVPAEDAKALSSAVLELKNMSASVRDEMGVNARNYYREHFDHENLVAELIAHLSHSRKVNL